MLNLEIVFRSKFTQVIPILLVVGTLNQKINLILIADRGVVAFPADPYNFIKI